MKLTKKTDYALRILLSLAEKGEGAVLSTRELSEKNAISLKFLQTVVSSLVKEGFLLSISGVHGGVKLNLLPNQISILDVIESLEGPMSLMDCMEESTLCGHFHNCKIQNVFGKAQLAVNEILSSCSLEDLMPCPVNSRF